MSTSSDNRTIEDILLKPDAIPAMPPKTMVKEALEMMTAGRLGLACVVDRKGCLVGLFTDGDLRRLVAEERAALEQNIEDIMTRKPLHLNPNDRALDAEAVLSLRSIDQAPVLDHAMCPATAFV